MNRSIVSVPLRGLLAALLAVLLLSSQAYAVEPSSDDPAVLAATYSKQAADLRADAEKHANIARMHRGGAGTGKTAHESIAKHCERIAENLRAAAAESDALAAQYRELAKK